MDTSKQAQQSYDAMVKKASPNSPILSNCIKAFVSGGLICVLGQALLMLYFLMGKLMEKPLLLVRFFRQKMTSSSPFLILV